MPRSTRTSSSSNKGTSSTKSIHSDSVSTKQKTPNIKTPQKATSTRPDKDHCPCGFENCRKEVIEDLEHRRNCACHVNDDTIDNWISCDFCNQWWHSACAGLTVKLCNIIQASEEPYKCGLCIQDTLNGKPQSKPAQKVQKVQNKDTSGPKDKQPDTAFRSSFGDKNIVILDGLNKEAFKGGSPALKRELNRLLGADSWPFVYRLSRGGVAIHCNSKETVDRILKFKWPKSAFCHSGKNIVAHLPGKSPRVVFKNIPTEFSNQEIEQSVLDTCGIKVKAHRNRYADTGKPLPVVTIQCENLEDSSYIYLHRPQILGTKVIVQAYRSKVHTATRCFNCNRFGHIAKNCVNTVICVKCGQSHTGKCISPINCSNCTGHHPADSLECETYLDVSNRLRKCTSTH